MLTVGDYYGVFAAFPSPKTTIDASKVPHPTCSAPDGFTPNEITNKNSDKLDLITNP